MANRNLRSITYPWRLAGRWLLFIMLTLGLAKTPLAYDCIALLDNDSNPADQLAGADVPCPQAQHYNTPADDKRECCLINIDNGLRGAETGFVISALQNTHPPDQPADLPIDKAWFSPGYQAITLATHPTVSVLPTAPQPPYLLTQRLRL